MKRTSLVLAALLLLTSCSSTPESSVAPVLPSVPQDCTKTKILDAFPERIPNPQFISTEWEPAEGTDLYAAYNAGGIACSYGIQEAEIGATVIWAPDNKYLFDELAAGWVKAGQQEFDLPNLDEEKAFVLTEGTEGEGEYHVWAINLLIKGSWISVAATFFGSIDEAMPLVNAAVDSLRSAKSAAKTSLIGCYMAELSEDLYVLNVHYHDNNTVSADYYLRNLNSGPIQGLLIGSYTNGVLRGFYSDTSQEPTIERELIFKGDKSGLVPGTSPVVRTNEVERFKTPLQITWNEDYKYSPAEDCETLFRK
ncbi:MAG: hypothetical protein ACK4WP_02840 [Candidatus Nanopelagicaceae bacterium]|jgi:hypothetical protein